MFTVTHPSCSQSLTQALLPTSSWSWILCRCREENQPAVTTTNQGSLNTTGCGTCIGELTLNSDKYQLTLNNCLHMPGAFLNLLSIGCMLQYGWSYDFRGSGPRTSAHCQLSHKGKMLGSAPMIGNLFYIDLWLLYPSKLATFMYFTKEISAVAKVLLTWDTWHAQMGHPSRDSVKRLSLVTMGVTVDIDQV